MRGRGRAWSSPSRWSRLVTRTAARDQDWNVWDPWGLPGTAGFPVVTRASTRRTVGHRHRGMSPVSEQIFSDFLSPVTDRALSSVTYWPRQRDTPGPPVGPAGRRGTTSEHDARRRPPGRRERQDGVPGDEQRPLRLRRRPHPRPAGGRGTAVRAQRDGPELPVRAGHARSGSPCPTVTGFFGQVVEAVERIARDRGVAMYLTCLGEDPDAEQAAGRGAAEPQHRRPARRPDRRRPVVPEALARAHQRWSSSTAAPASSTPPTSCTTTPAAPAWPSTTCSSTDTAGSRSPATGSPSCPPPPAAAPPTN